MENQNNFILKIKEEFLSRVNWLLAGSALVATIGCFFFAVQVADLMHDRIAPIGLTKIFFIFLVATISYFVYLIYVLKNPVGSAYIIKRTLLAFLLPEIILLYALNLASKFIFINGRNILGIIVSLYLLIGGFYLLFHYKKYKKISEFFGDFREKKKEPKSILAIMVVTIVIATNLVFGLYHLADYAAVDEPLWTHDRIPNFWTNISEQEFGKTMISDKPGITVALLSGLGLLAVNPHDYKNIHPSNIPGDQFLNITQFNFAMRLPIFLFNCFILIVIYLILKKAFGEMAALLATIFVGLSPIILGISSIINPDSLLWVFTTLSLITYFVYSKEDSNKYLYLCGIFLGLAILTKYVANILYVFFLGSIFINYIINKDQYQDISFRKYLGKAFSDYLVIIFFSLGTFLLFLPAAWVNIKYLLNGTIASKAFAKVWPLFLGVILLLYADMLINKSRLITPIIDFFHRFRRLFINFFFVLFLLSIAVVFINVYGGMKFFDLEAIIASPKTSHTTTTLIGSWLANFYSLVFGLNPLILVAAVGFVISVIFSRKSEDRENFFSFSLVLFIIFYYLASLIEDVSATVRYQIILYPPAFILAALGLQKVYAVLRQKKISSFRHSLPVFYAIMITVSIYSLYSIRPFYFSYASDLLPKEYVLNLKDMGDGSYEAAAYLNKLSNPEKLVIWTDKKGVCVFFVGQCLNGFSLEEGDIAKIDYFVASAGRETRSTKMTNSKASLGDPAAVIINKLYSRKNFDYKLEIGGRPNNYVGIISTKKLLNN